jgi:hypothetical protein
MAGSPYPMFSLCHSVPLVPTTKLLIKQTQTGKTLMPLVWVLVPVLGMAVSSHIALLTSGKGKGVYLIQMFRHTMTHLKMQTHEH